jgi:hypothetical protein
MVASCQSRAGASAADDLVRTQRVPLPEHVHDCRFGFADLHRLHP